MFLGFEPFGDYAVSTGPAERLNTYVISQAAIDWQTIIYAASHELISGPNDSPPDRAYYGTMEKAFRIQRSVIGADRIGEAVTIGLGENRLSNHDANYDELAADTTAIGQKLLIRMGDRRKYFAGNWINVLRGYSAGFTIDRESMVFNVRDAGWRLDVPLSQNIYGGTGGEDGTVDVKGKRKQLCFGHLLNVTAPLIDPTNLSFQVHDGRLNAIEKVYVRGVELTLDADYENVAAMNGTSLSAGEYATCIAQGWFRVAVAGGTELGQVTCDLEGENTGEAFPETAADIVRRMLAIATDYADPDELVTSAFDDLNTVQPAPIGYLCPLGSDETVAGAVGKIMAGVGGWGGALRDERYGVWRLDTPSGVPTALYDATNLADAPALAQIPEDLSPPPWRVRVPFGRNWTVQTDLAGSVSDARRAFCAEENRYATAESNTIKRDHPPGHEVVFDAYFRDESDAQDEADRRLALWGARPELYVIKLAQLLPVHELGETIKVTFPRLRLDDGKLLRVVRTVDDDAEGVELMAVG